MTNNKILIICPSRNRGHKIENFYKVFKDMSVMSDIVFSLDEDDYQNYPVFKDDGVFYEVGYKNDIVPAINYVAYKYAQNKQYEFIGMLNDNHWIETFGWDKIVYEKIKDDKTAIAYFNDLDPNMEYLDIRTGKMVPTKDLFASSVIMNSNIIRCLGYMANPMLKHAYPDVIWLDLGRKLNSLYYFNDVVVAHKNLGEEDGFHEYSYREKEERLYMHYWENSIDKDVDTIKKYIEVYYE